MEKSNSFERATDLFEDSTESQGGFEALAEELGFIETVEIRPSGSFGIDDGPTFRLYPSDENLINFANNLETEIHQVLCESRIKYADRVKFWDKNDFSLLPIHITKI